MNAAALAEEAACDTCRDMAAELCKKYDAHLVELYLKALARELPAEVERTYGDER